MPNLAADVVFEGGYDHGVLIRCEVREGFGKHQIAILDFPVPASEYTNLAPEMTPVTFEWGWAPTGLRTFWGYVNHHETVNLDGESVLRFFLIGTSQPLNAPWPNSWKGVTASYVARLVAERHGLRAIIHNSKTVLPYVTPGPDSDLALITRLADEAGFKCWVDGATLYFVDPTVMLTSPSRSIAAEYDFDRLSTDTIFGIQTVSGSMAPVASAPTVQRVFGLDENAGRLIQASSARSSSDAGLAAPINTTVYGKAVSSLAEAHRVSDLAATSGSWETLQVVTKGDGQARVGSLVSLAGQALNQAYSGVWMAGDIIHVMAPADRTSQWTYSTQIELTRNQKGKPFFSSFSSLKDTFSEVPAVLRSGRWESSILESVYV
jgi:hypothetical protein